MLVRIIPFVMIASLAACGDDRGGSPDGGSMPDSATGFSIHGSVGGTSIPSSAKAVVVWVVSSGTPDYGYKYGEGMSVSTSFMVTMAADPPAQAINSYGIGVGLVALVDAGTQVPDGILEEDQLFPLGLSTRHAIIWKDPARPGLDWSGPFPAGYGCGRCVPAAGGTFDTFEPVACSELQVETAADPTTLEVCNWT